MTAIHELSEKNTRRAWEIVNDMDLDKIWQSIGGQVNLVGSLKTGLLTKHLDIDFHVYTPELKLADSFFAMSQLAANPCIKKMECTNLIETDEVCIEWHAWYQDCDNALWQIDIIHILRGSTYDGFAEKAAERIAAVLTPETKKIIRQLKYDTPNTEKVMGIEYYMAVLRDSVQTYADFQKWRQNNPVHEVILWTP